MGKKSTEKVKENEKRRIDIKTRYFELKATISESHKEQLDELLTIVGGTSILILEGKYSENYCHEIKKERERKKKERVELYQKYLKNKDIQIQIMDLEHKIDKLKGEIIK